MGGARARFLTGRQQVFAFVVLAAVLVVSAAIVRSPHGQPQATSTASGTALAPSGPAATGQAPGATLAPIASGSAIVPGSVDRTSIGLEATYDANVDLGFDTRSLAVDVSISVTNRSGDGIDRIELNTITAPLGRIRLQPVQVDGRDVAAKVDDQSIVVPLGGVLPDGATTVLRVRLRATMRSNLSGSSWMFTRIGDTLQASRWLPWVGLRRPFDRPNYGDPFFTALSPHVRVRVTTDRRLVIATPGRRVSVDGLAQTFEADNVRDFHIVASPRFTVRERRVGGITLRAFARPGFPSATALGMAADGLTRMARLAGAYPYATFVIAETAGGYALEAPGMIWIPPGLTGSRLRWNVYHETAHQWFYSLVGSDGALQPFADETIGNHLSQVVSGVWPTTSCPMKRLDLSIYHYSGRCYFGQIYVRGARLLEKVRRAMAPGEYWRAVRQYVSAHRFEMGSTREFLETLQANTSRDLRPILAPWFPSIY